MRYFLFALLFCMGPLLYSQSTIPMPFYQSYDSYDYNNKPDYHKLEVNFAPFTPVKRCPGSTDITAVANAKGFSWDLYDRTSDPERGKAIKLNIDDDDLICLGSDPADGRRRSEMLYKLPEMEGNTSYIQWSFFIPKTQEFPDVNENPINDPPYYHKIFQILVSDLDPNGNPYSGNPTYPLVGIEYKHNPQASLGVDTRDLYIQIESPNQTPSRHYRLTVEDAIEKGVWNDITYKTKWSNDDAVGFVELFINGLPLVVKPGTNPPDSGNSYIATLVVDPNPAVDPYKIECATIDITDSRVGKANDIKFGHYRRNLPGSHAIYIDDIEVSDFDPKNEPDPIKLVSGDCNVAIPIDNQNITCDDLTLEGVTNYKFRFEHNGTYYWANSATNTLNLLDQSFLQPQTTYNVQVRAQGADFDIVYGDICSITMPHQTKVRINDCVLNSTQYNGTIRALTVNNTTKYKFRFRDTDTQALYYGNTTSHILTPSSVVGIVEDRTYEVHVRAMEPLIFNYGDGCYIMFESDEKSLKTEKPAIIPNPFTERITLTGFSDIEFIKIADLSGNVVYSQKRFEGNTLNLQFLKKGFYFVEITSANTPYMFRLIKE